MHQFGRYSTPKSDKREATHNLRLHNSGDNKLPESSNDEQLTGNVKYSSIIIGLKRVHKEHNS